MSKPRTVSLAQYAKENPDMAHLLSTAPEPELLPGTRLSCSVATCAVPPTWRITPQFVALGQEPTDRGDVWGSCDEHLGRILHNLMPTPGAWEELYVERVRQ